MTKIQFSKAKSQTITLNILFDEYIDLIEPLQSKQTIVTKKSIFKKHIKDTYGDSDLNILKFKDYQILINNLLNNGLKPKTVKNIKDLLQVMYKMAIRLEYTDKNPLLDVEIPKFDNKLHFSYSTDLQKKFIQTILSFSEPDYSDIFIFLLHGRRLSEVLSIEWEMIDLSQRIYYIPARINKAKRNMAHKMTTLLYAILQDRYIEAIEFQNTSFPTGLVFKNLITDKKYVDLRRPWKRLLASGNLPKTRIHDIRHLIGTYAINTLELPIEKVSHCLGHTSIEVTQRYITPKPENSRYVIQSLFDSVCNEKEKNENSYV